MAKKGLSHGIYTGATTVEGIIDESKKQANVFRKYNAPKFSTNSPSQRTWCWVEVNGTYVKRFNKI